MQQKIIPYLWFNNEAEEAVDFYTNIFDEGNIVKTSRYTGVGRTIHGMKAGTVITVEFTIENMKFIALNGGAHSTFSPAISFVLSCPTERKVAHVWKKLLDKGTVLLPMSTYPLSKRYGWIKDQYGVSWHIVLDVSLPHTELTTSLLFAGAMYGKAEEAIRFYTTLFGNYSTVGKFFSYKPTVEKIKQRTVMYSEFTLDGQKFSAMDSAGGHEFSFSEANSFVVYCKSQVEAEYLRKKLSTTPYMEKYGWLTDKYGVSWHIVPAKLSEVRTVPKQKKIRPSYARAPKTVQTK